MFHKAMLIGIIDRKLGYKDKHIKYINTRAVKASQYNPLDGSYHKKELKDRMIDLGDNIIVQRDMLSAYIIEQSTSSLDRINVRTCRKLSVLLL